MSLVQGLEEQRCVACVCVGGWGVGGVYWWWYLGSMEHISLSKVPWYLLRHFNSTKKNTHAIGGKTVVIELRTTISQRAKGIFSLESYCCRTAFIFPTIKKLLQMQSLTFHLYKRGRIYHPHYKVTGIIPWDQIPLTCEGLRKQLAYTDPLPDPSRSRWFTGGKTYNRYETDWQPNF